MFYLFFIKGGYEMKIPIKSIGQFCKMYRTYVLDLTLEEMSKRTGVKVPTISSFENDRSTNSKHIEMYYNLSKSDEERKFFKNNIPYGKGD